jgi:hypothetical protein
MLDEIGRSYEYREITPVVPLTLRGIKGETALILEKELAG